MKSLIDEVLNFYIVERNNLQLRVGDYFLHSFTDSDHGPFLITNMNSEQITFIDLATGKVVRHDTSNFKRVLHDHIYKIEIK